jgi:hypothetical protein
MAAKPVRLSLKSAKRSEKSTRTAYSPDSGYAWVGQNIFKSQQEESIDSEKSSLWPFKPKRLFIKPPFQLKLYFLHASLTLVFDIDDRVGRYGNALTGDLYSKPFSFLDAIGQPVQFRNKLFCRISLFNIPSRPFFSFRHI